MDIRPAANSLATIIEKSFAPLQDLPESRTILNPAPIYFKTLKTTLGLSASWRIGNVVHMTSILENYFRIHPTTNTLDMTVRADDGLRATIKIAKVPVQAFLTQYPSRQGSTERSSLQIYFYTADRANLQDGQGALSQGDEWCTSHPRPTDYLPPNTVYSFSAGSTELYIRLPDFSPDAGDLTYRELHSALTAVGSLVRQRLNNQWSAYSGTLYDPTGKVQGFLLYVIDLGSPMSLAMNVSTS